MVCGQHPIKIDTAAVRILALTMLNPVLEARLVLHEHNILVAGQMVITLRDAAYDRKQMDMASFVMLTLYTLMGLVALVIIAANVNPRDLDWTARLSMGIMALLSLVTPIRAMGEAYIRHLFTASGALMLMWMSAGIIWAPAICVQMLGGRA
jgi:hypothetical protein